MATRKRRSDEERLEELNRKKAAIEARRKALQARVAKKERARDTRRKILVGAYVFHQIENDRKRGPGLRNWLKEGFPGFLREIDRELFPDIFGVADGEGSSDGENAGTAGEAGPPERNAPKITNTARILRLLERVPDLDDDQIADELAINRSTVHQECELLARAGILHRRKGGPGNKLISSIIDQATAPQESS